MASHENLVQEGFGRLNEAVESVSERVQKELRTRRRSLERQLKTGRRDLERQARKQVKRLQGELRRNPALKRATSAASEVQRRVEAGVDALLGAFQIASKSDLARIDRKLDQLSRKLKEIEKTRKGNGAAAAAM
jgi:hypothetical protein